MVSTTTAIHDFGAISHLRSQFALPKPTIRELPLFAVKESGDKQNNREAYAVDTIAGYEIVEVVDVGPRSAIYRGVKVGGKQSVILKTLTVEHPSLRDIATLKHEYEITADLDIDGLIRPYGLKKHGNGLVLLLEDIGGETLKKMIADQRIDLITALKIAIRLAGIVGEIHQHNIIHKDIKPSNIIVDLGTEQVKLTDFGIASRLSQENQSGRQLGMLEGTLAYMPPEQTGRINRAIDYRTDFYSLGVTLYEILTGRLPFEWTDPMALVHAHIARDPVPPHLLNGDIPETVSEIVLKLMAKGSEDRYQGSYGLRVDLERCLNQRQSGGAFEAFPLGRHDVSGRFQIPQRLYGREQAVATLQDACQRADQGSVEMVLVSGYSGAGKTTLVNEIRQPAMAQGGYFFTGKFERLQRNFPYRALIQAVQDLIRQLLTESDESIAAWKEDILRALGANGQVIVDVLPELALIIGPQPAVPSLAPTEAQNRFNLAWLNFFGAFTAREHLLVLFLDDMQWADSASLHLMHYLLTNIDQHHLLMLGAFRANEINPAHPLVLTLEKIEEEGTRVSHVELSGLDMAPLNRMIADTLHADLESAAPLASLVFDKTEGNPFFVAEFLKTLHQEKLLWLDLDQGSWLWNLRQIQEMDITDNVVVLMSAKIEKLAPQARNAMTMAAFIGATFDLETLAFVCERSPAETAADLWAPIQEGLLLPDSDFGFWMVKTEHETDTAEHGVVESTNAESDPIRTEASTCRFLHDRVQQAAYALTGEEERKAIHLKIGRLLLKRVADDETALDEALFDLVSHLNLGADLISAQAEAEELARLNLAAGQRAKAATAYEAAQGYLTAGKNLLTPDSWQSAYDLTLALNLAWAEAEYLVGNFQVAEEGCDAILDNVRTEQDRDKVYRLRMRLYTSLSQYQKAIATGLEAAAVLGMRLPANPGSVQIIREFMTAKWNLLGKNVNSLLDLPEMVDRRQLATVNLLTNLTSAAFLSQPPLAIVVALKMLNSTLKQGTSDLSPFGYMVYGALNAGMGNTEVAYQYGQLALKLEQNRGDAVHEHRLKFIFASAINHWQRHARTNLDYLAAAYDSALAVGDLIYADFSLATAFEHSCFKGDPLDEVWKRCEQYTHFYRQAKGIDLADTLQGQMALLYQQQILSLKGQTERQGDLGDDTFDEGSFQTVLEENLAFFQYYIIKLPLLVFFERYAEALDIAMAGDEFIGEAVQIGDIRVPDHYYYSSLALCACYPAASPGEQRRFRRMLKNNRKKLKKWAENCPENFDQKYLLMAAEMARISGEEHRAADLYDQAILSARENEYLQDEAMANELAAKFYLAKGREKVAKPYLLDARHGYLKWGAAGKVEALNNAYPRLLNDTSRPEEPEQLTTITATGGDSSQRLDLATVMKASQAISGEIELEKLLSTLMAIVIENAGAQVGYFLLEKGGKWVIEAEGAVEKEDVTALLPSTPIARSMEGARERPYLPISIINYVARTKETVVLADAARAGVFVKDPAIIQQQTRSILCMPLVNQGELSGMLYLENNLTAGAFTPDRQEFLRLLSGQAAISIDNANLYARQVALTNAASRFVPHEFLTFLNKESLAEVELGDNARLNLTIFVSDIRSFTTLSEKMTPEENFDFINAYFQAVAPVIRKHRGFIGKYMGDGLMAFFPKEAGDAIRASTEILQQLRQYNADRQERDELPIQTGFGIHSGHVMLGTIGEEGRMQGDVMSDAANLTSRLEGLTRFYGASVVITAETLQQLGDPSRFKNRFLGKVQVKGRRQAVSICELLEGDLDGVAELKLQTKADFEQGLEQYYDRQFADAKVHFERVLQANPTDNAARLYLKRVAQCLAQGVATDWTGIESLTEK